MDAVLDAGLEEKAVLTSFEYGTLRRVKDADPEMKAKLRLALLT